METVMDKPITYVKATEDNSCVPACLAMVTRKTLKHILSDIYEYWEAEGKISGTTNDIVDEYLSQNGYAIQRINYEYSPAKLLIEGWPIDPFAPIHIVDVWSSDPAGMHAVVMDKSGKIYDPSNRRIKKISEYQRVFSITGIWKVSDTTLISITKG